MKQSSMRRHVSWMFTKLSGSIFASLLIGMIVSIAPMTDSLNASASVPATQMASSAPELAHSGNGCFTSNQSGIYMGINTEYMYCFQNAWGLVCGFYIQSGNFLGVAYAKVMEQNGYSCNAVYEGDPAVEVVYSYGGQLYDQVNDDTGQPLGSWIQAQGPSGSSIVGAWFEISLSQPSGYAPWDISGSPLD